ncbi:MAG: SDR family oxidoreductase [Gemmatimonadetes bacterium]|nr:SDR family oxidoreductase [Gemmatimonadota bacterium]MBT7862312.1 SDR family oxidoreductase [Gemmatimonadota bacterium]
MVDRTKPSMFANRSILITGASSGLGAALAQSLAAGGARLTLMARRGDRLAEVVAACEAVGGTAQAIEGDVTRVEDGQRLTSAAVDAYGQIDGLIANAGLSMWARFDEVEDLGVFRRLMEVNYLGAVHCVHPALPYLKKSGGMFVAISSIQARIGVPNHTGYVASKHALQGFCDALRMEVADDGVGILSVLLHWLRDTELREHAFGADGEAVGASRRKHSSESIGLEEACEKILAAMGRREREIVLPWKLKALLGVNLLRPQMAEALIRRAVGKQERH